MRTIAVAIVIVCSAAPLAHAQSNPGSAAIPVGVVVAERKSVAKSLEFAGRVEALQRVEITPRITGYLKAINFKEGDLVREGASLYSLDRTLFEAAVQQAEGALERSKASKALAHAQFQRAEELLAKQVAAPVARDQALAADQVAGGQIAVDEANLKAAKVNLSYTDIVSPISGRVGRTNVTTGNVVGPQSGALTVVVSQDPMYVTVPVTEREFLRAREAAHNGDMTGIKASLRFADGSSYKRDGTVTFVDVVFDRSSDTIQMRAVFPNPDSKLIDGQLVRVALEDGFAEERVVIPQAALMSDRDGIYVFVVESGKATVRRVKAVAAASGPGVVIEQGLSGGEQVIVEGKEAVRPGIPVNAKPQLATPAAN